MSGFPGCSNGFNQLEMTVSGLTVRVKIGNAEVQAIPLMPMLDIAIEMISDNPHALLCNNPECGRCQAVRTTGTSPTTSSLIDRHSHLWYRTTTAWPYYWYPSFTPE